MLPDALPFSFSFSFSFSLPLLLADPSAPVDEAGRCVPEEDGRGRDDAALEPVPVAAAESAENSRTGGWVLEEGDGRARLDELGSVAGSDETGKGRFVDVDVDADAPLYWCASTDGAEAAEGMAGGREDSCELRPLG